MNISCDQLQAKLITCRDYEDRYKLGLLYFPETVLLGKEKMSLINLNWLEIVEDEKEFNQFPWGTETFQRTVHSLNRALIGRSKKFTKDGLQVFENYKFLGFPYVFQVPYRCDCTVEICIFKVVILISMVEICILIVICSYGHMKQSQTLVKALPNMQGINFHEC